jgi:hypothetical protein
MGSQGLQDGLRVVAGEFGAAGTADTLSNVQGPD